MLETVPVHVFEDRTGRRKLVVICAIIAILAAFAIIAADFFLRLRNLPPPSQMTLETQETSGAALHDTTYSVFLDEGKPLGCGTRPSPADVAGRMVAAFLPAADTTAASAMALRCGEIDLLLAETFALDIDAVTIYRTAQPLNPASARFDVIGMTGMASVDMLEAVLGSTVAMARIAADLNRLTDQQPGGFCLDLTKAPTINPDIVVHAVSAMQARMTEDICVIGAIDAAFWDKAELVDLIDLAVAKAFVEPDRPTVPPADPDWYDAHIARLTQQVPSEKLIVALGGFGHAWQSGRAEPERLTYTGVIDRMVGAQSDPVQTAVLGSTRIRLVDAERRLNDIWLQDGATFYNQISRLDGAQAVAIWPIGYEDPVVWSLLDPALTAEEAVRILDLPIDLGQVLQITGAGPFLDEFELAVPGSREITADPLTGRIVSSSYSALPLPNRIALTGQNSTGELYLTFDGLQKGRDLVALLAALQDGDVSATFFVDGATILSQADGLRHLLAAGHEVGIAQARSSSVASEDLIDNGTQLLLVRETGNGTRFVRYQADDRAWPGDHGDLDAFTRQLARAYIPVGPGIAAPHGPFDPGSLVARVNDEVTTDRSGIVNFELGNGNTANVVAALPAFLSGLQEAGYHFGTLHNAAGIRPDDPVLPLAGGGLMRDTVAFGAINLYLFGLTPFFFILMIFAGLRSMIYLGLALWRGRKTAFDPAFHPPVTIIVPAYNEEMVIEKCLESLLASDYPDLRIVVVDDGSTDRTYQMVTDLFGTDDRITLLHQENRGKWRAANNAISNITTPYFIIADADSLFFPDTVGWLMQQFKDDDVGAVSGLVEVGNRESFLTSCQALEYIVSQSVLRRAYEVFEGILVVPGAVGAWRTEAVTAAQGFSGETITEDADLTIAVHRAGYRVRFQEQARAVTEAPANVRAFMRQRLRWTFGMIEVSWKHRRAITERRAVGISIADAVWLGLVSSLISPIVDLLLLLMLGKIVLSMIAGEAIVWSGFPIAVFISYFLLTGLDLLNMLVALRFERRFDWRLLALVPLLRFGYRQLLYISTINAIWHALVGQMAGWNKLERTGAVFRMGESGNPLSMRIAAMSKPMEPGE